MRRTRSTPAGARAALGRDFWLYFSGQAVSQLGGSFTLFAMPLLVFRLTHSATSLALTTAAEFVPYLLFGLLLGAVVDRFDRKRLMLGADIAQALVIAVVPVLALAGLLRVADIYAVTFVQSTLGIIFNCGEFAAIPASSASRTWSAPTPASWPPTTRARSSAPGSPGRSWRSCRSLTSCSWTPAPFSSRRPAWS